MLEKTVIDIVTQAERELHQSAGMSVQVYSQDQLAMLVQNSFDLIFDDVTHRWKRFERATIYTLDGTTGHTTTPVSTIYKHYEDIQHVYPGSSTRALANWGGGNPSAITGGTAVFVAPGDTDIIKVYPSTASGQITVVGKARPDRFTIRDTVPFDAATVAYLTAWQYAVDDGTNPGSAEKLRQLYEQRYKQMKLNSSKEPIALNSSYGNLPMSWRDDAY